MRRPFSLLVLCCVVCVVALAGATAVLADLLPPAPGSGKSLGARASGVHADASGDHDDEDPGPGPGVEEEEEEDDESDDAVSLARLFATDPLADPTLVLAGDALDRVSWQLDPPAFAGDAPGSLRARYDSSLPPGLLGFRLPRALDEDDTFLAGALFEIDSDGFQVGLFQISFGLWNTETTGLLRTGTPVASADTFELFELNWFPSEEFGGPFLAPVLFGEQVSHDAFANFTTVFDLSVELPRDRPLLALVENRPGADVVTLQVWEVRGPDELAPLTRGVAAAPLGFLTRREYAFDAIGLTLWQDGFLGSNPPLLADVSFHGLFVETTLVRPETLLGAAQDEDDDDEEDD